MSDQEGEDDMSGGHGHEHATASHGATGPADAPAHDEAHGHGELPPEPATREITPAVADYRQPWPGPLLLWPVVWLGVGALFVLLALAWNRPMEAHGAGHGEGPAGPAHEAPAHPEGPAPAHGGGH